MVTHFCTAPAALGLVPAPSSLAMNSSFVPGRSAMAPGSTRAMNSFPLGDPSTRLNPRVFDPNSSLVSRPLPVANRMSCENDSEAGITASPDTAVPFSSFSPKLSSSSRVSVRKRQILPPPATKRMPLCAMSALVGVSQLPKSSFTTRPSEVNADTKPALNAGSSRFTPLSTNTCKSGAQPRSVSSAQANPSEPRYAPNRKRRLKRGAYVSQARRRGKRERREDTAQRGRKEAYLAGGIVAGHRVGVAGGVKGFRGEARHHLQRLVELRRHQRLLLRQHLGVEPRLEGALQCLVAGQPRARLRTLAHGERVHAHAHRVLVQPVVVHVLLLLRLVHQRLHKRLRLARLLRRRRLQRLERDDPLQLLVGAVPGVVVVPPVLPAEGVLPVRIRVVVAAIRVLLRNPLQLLEGHDRAAGALREGRNARRGRVRAAHHLPGLHHLVRGHGGRHLARRHHRGGAVQVAAAVAVARHRDAEDVVVDVRILVGVHVLVRLVRGRRRRLRGDVRGRRRGGGQLLRQPGEQKLGVLVAAAVARHLPDDVRESVAVRSGAHRARRLRLHGANRGNIRQGVLPGGALVRLHILLADGLHVLRRLNRKLLGEGAGGRGRGGGNVIRVDVAGGVGVGRVGGGVGTVLQLVRVARGREGRPGGHALALDGEGRSRSGGGSGVGDGVEERQLLGEAHSGGRLCVGHRVEESRGGGCHGVRHRVSHCHGLSQAHIRGG
eukprot:1188732-Prorocentrum_minimum.AAC.1